MKSIIFIVTTFGKMQYEFENKIILKVPKKLIIIVINPLICYLITEVSYIKQLLIIKLIFISIKFEFLNKISYTYDSSVKPRKKNKT